MVISRKLFALSWLMQFMQPKTFIKNLKTYVGDQIRYKFFREKRIREKRIYYLIYDDLKAVLVIAFEGKKAQQETIDAIVRLFPEYRNYAENLLKADKKMDFI